MTISEAFMITPRRYFLPESQRKYAVRDAPLPIGYGQTNSQPTTVRRMLEWLDVGLGQNVLDIGSGSGWTTALLSRLVGQTGRVIAIEKIPELVKAGRLNCKELGLDNVEFHQATEELGWPDEGPYDRILVSAAGAVMPESLIGQLDTPGKLVIPIGGSIYEIEKNSSGKINETAHPGYIFVPLV